MPWLMLVDKILAQLKTVPFEITWKSNRTHDVCTPFHPFLRKDDTSNHFQLELDF